MKMKQIKIIFALLSLSPVFDLVAQDANKPKPNAVTVQDTSKAKSGAAITSPEQPFHLADTGITDLGVAVSPSNVRFRTKPGSSETKYITVTNDTHKSEKFKISFADYNMNNQGAVAQLPIGQNHEYGVSKWMSITPSFVELKAGEKKKIAVTLSIPDDPTAYRAGWGLIMVDQTKERESLAPPKDQKDNIVMGVIPVFGFGIFVFQNPPNVKINKVEILKFNYAYDDKNRYVNITVKNVGDGLAFCKAYIEISNLNNGFKDKLMLRQLTIFPGMERNIDYTLPGALPKGKYVATAVMDFGSDSEVEAAELEFTIN
ncbi:MAG: hypothetical protein HYU69_10835 [Bacteroidetes bacterium]|nr:hypothetical protein [Bacteroidota bacterium]